MVDLFFRKSSVLLLFEKKNFHYAINSKQSDNTIQERNVILKFWHNLYGTFNQMEEFANRLSVNMKLQSFIVKFTE